MSADKENVKDSAIATAARGRAACEDGDAAHSKLSSFDFEGTMARLVNKKVRLAKGGFIEVTIVLRYDPDTCDFEYLRHSVNRHSFDLLGNGAEWEVEVDVIDTQSVPCGPDKCRKVMRLRVTFKMWTIWWGNRVVQAASSEFVVSYRTPCTVKCCPPLEDDIDVWDVDFSDGETNREEISDG